MEEDMDLEDKDLLAYMEDMEVGRLQDKVEDMEEGIHFNRTQKIPISLIK